MKSFIWKWLSELEHLPEVDLEGPLPDQRDYLHLDRKVMCSAYSHGDAVHKGGGCTQWRDAKPSWVPKVVSTHGWASAIMFSETENNIHEPHVNLSITNYSMSEKTYENTPLSIYLHAFVEITLQGCVVSITRNVWLTRPKIFPIAPALRGKLPDS